MDADGMCMESRPPFRVQPNSTKPLPFHPSDGKSLLNLTTVVSFDGHHVPISIYKPVIAGPNTTVPVILHSHGWAGTRATAEDFFIDYVKAGFGVVSIDMRGHGGASDTSVARVHRMDFEIKDVQVLIDEIATWDWVYLDGAGDPRLGAIGGSYGGAYQLLTAAVDNRLDAIVPQITWNNLPRSLAPNEAPKSAWLDLLYWGAKATGTSLAPEIDDGYRWVQLVNDFPDGKQPGEPDIRTPFIASSPMSYPDSINIPTLIIQGTSDTLFNLNEGVANYLQIGATGAPVGLVTHLNGHIINTQGTIPASPPQPVGLQPPAGPDPCGTPTELGIQWFHRYLIGLDVEVPQVCLAMEDATTLNGTAYPLPGSSMQPFSLGDVTVPVGSKAEAIEVTILEVANRTVVSGIPHISGSASSPGPDAIVFWTLEVIPAAGERRIINSQVTPMRLTGSAEIDMDLMGVGVILDVGDRLVIVASDRNAQYVHNEGRIPGIVTVSGLTLDLPIVAA